MLISCMSRHCELEICISNNSCRLIFLWKWFLILEECDIWCSYCRCLAPAQQALKLCCMMTMGHFFHSLPSHFSDSEATFFFPVWFVSYLTLPTHASYSNPMNFKSEYVFFFFISMDFKASSEFSSRMDFFPFYQTTLESWGMYVFLGLTIPACDLSC